ncbi:hypothetical protein LT493_02340 [Streptomyces tricolor]|nr:hypothetical protein [Streptomyces tricolor]
MTPGALRPGAALLRPADTPWTAGTSRSTWTPPPRTRSSTTPRRAAGPDPGRIPAAAEAHREATKDDRVTRRHYFNQIVLTPLPDDSIRATLYALVVRTRHGEKVPDIWPSCLLEDVLTVDGDEILLRSRHISYD